jgi:hypothetical protein
VFRDELEEEAEKRWVTGGDGRGKFLLRGPVDRKRRAQPFKPKPGKEYI